MFEVTLKVSIFGKVSVCCYFGYKGLGLSVECIDLEKLFALNSKNLS